MAYSSGTEQKVRLVPPANPERLSPYPSRVRDECAARLLRAGSPARLEPTRREEVRDARNAAQRRRRGTKLRSVGAMTPYRAPPCDRPAPKAAVDRWAAWFSPGPEAGPQPGEAGYDLNVAGPGYRAEFRETRARYFWLGGSATALAVAVEDTSFDPATLARLMFDLGDISIEEACEVTRSAKRWEPRTKTKLVRERKRVR